MCCQIQFTSTSCKISSVRNKMSLTSINMSKLILSVALLLSSSSIVWAQSAEDHFNQGVFSSGKGNHEAALKFFNKARKAGMRNPSLDYNQALSHYRLGQYAQARKFFISLGEDKAYAQLAYLHLGLIANKQNDEKTAVTWFQKAYTNNNNRKVTALAETALKRLGKAPNSQKRQKPAWKGFVSTSLASDSNVTLADDVNQPSANDTYMEIFASGNTWLTGNRKSGVRLELSGDLQKYNTETQYNYSKLSIGISRFKKYDQWKTRLKGAFDDIKVDGTGYEQIFSVMADTRKTLDKNSELQMRYRFSSIDTPKQVYNHLTGTRHQFRIGMQKRFSKKRLKAYHQYELNDRKDSGSHATNNFNSYSPTRQSLNIMGSFPLQNKLKMRLDGRYRASDYADANSLAGGGTKKRSDTQQRVRATLEYEIEKNIELNLQYALTENDSNINSFDYDRTLIQLGVNWFI